MRIDPIFLRPKMVADILGISKATLYRLIHGGVFPPPVRLGPGITGWRKLDVEVWLAGRVK